MGVPEARMLLCRLCVAGTLQRTSGICELTRATIDWAAVCKRAAVDDLQENHICVIHTSMVEPSVLLALRFDRFVQTWWWPRCTDDEAKDPSAVRAP